MKDDKGFRPGEVARSREPNFDMVGAGQKVPAYAGFDPVEVPQTQWDHFTYQPEMSVSYAGTSVAAPTVDAAQAKRQKGILDSDFEIDEALRGLSQPARPRVNIPADSGSFAPAREAEADHAQQSITMDDFDELIASELAAMRSPQVSYVDSDDDQALGYDDSYADPELDYSHDLPPVHQPSRGKRWGMLAAGVALIAVVGGVGAYMMGGGSGGLTGDGPLLVRADTEPYKVAPADPGGRAIPNQNKAVYERLSRDGPAPSVQQQELVTAIEEPLDISEEESASDLPGVMVGETMSPSASSADDIETASVESGQSGAESLTLQPRKVRTLTVLPDGTLVQKEVPAAPTQPDLLTATSQTTPAANLEPIGGIEPAMPFGASGNAASAGSTPTVASPAEASVAAPAPEQQVAALEPQPSAPPPGSFFVQISSQPSEALAKESLQNLGNRYSSVIAGRSLGIQSAEIPGKGTYYRVRVTTASRDEANSVCEKLKSAGGSCFVTR